MADTGTINVRNLSLETVAGLNKVWRKKGYNSREEMIRDTLGKLAKDELVLESEARYLQIIRRQEMFIKWMAEIVVLHTKIEIRSNPFEGEE